MSQIKIQSPFLKANQNVFEGDVCKILNEGAEEESKIKDEVTGNYKKLWQFQVQLPDGEIKLGSFNNQSLRKFIEAWGTDTKEWVEKEIIAKDIAKMSAFGRMVEVIYWQPK